MPLCILTGSRARRGSAFSAALDNKSRVICALLDQGARLEVPNGDDPTEVDQALRSVRATVTSASDWELLSDRAQALRLQQGVDASALALPSPAASPTAIALAAPADSGDEGGDGEDHEVEMLGRVAFLLDGVLGGEDGVLVRIAAERDLAVLEAALDVASRKKAQGALQDRILALAGAGHGDHVED